MADWLTNILAADFAAREAERQRQAAQQAALQAQLNDPNSVYNQRIAAAEAAAAEQNQFNRDITQGGLDVQRQNAKTNQYNARTSRQNADTSQFTAETGRYSAETDRTYREQLVKQAAEDLAFKYYQQNQQNAIAQGQLDVSRGNLGLNTLQLGSSLTGVRNWDRYLETAAAAGQNPMLQNALGTWSSLTNVRPNTGAVSGPLPQKFDLNALASDFMGGGASGQAGQRNADLDRVAMNPASAAPGWWQGLSGDEKQRSLGYWESNGFSPSSILNSLAYTAPNQGFSYGGL